MKQTIKTIIRNPAQFLRGSIFRTPTSKPAFAVLGLTLITAVAFVLVVTVRGAGNAILSIEPASGSYNMNDTITLSVYEDSGTDAADSAAANLTFDATKLQYVSYSFTGGAFDLCVATTPDAHVSMGCTKSSGTVTGKQLVGTVTFKAISGSGQADVTFAADSAILSNPDGVNIWNGQTAGASLSLTSSDPTPPTVSVTSPTEGQSLTGTVTFSADASDNTNIAKVEFRVDGNLQNTATTAPYTTTIDTAKLSNGAHTFQATAYDDVGNSTPASVSATVANTDGVNPTVQITAPASGATVGGAAAFTATANDNGGVVKVEFSIDGTILSTDTDSPYEATINGASLSAGQHTITATAYDNVGNTGTDTRTITVDNSDTIDPTVSVLTPTDGSTVSGVTPFSANASDNSAVAKVDFSVDGNLIESDTSDPYSITVDTSTLSNGPHSFQATVSDASGRSAAASANVTVANGEPAAAPVIDSFTANPDTVSVGQSSNLAWTTQNAVACSVSPNGPQSTTTPYWQTPAFDASGPQVFTLNCQNSAGAEVTQTVTVTVGDATGAPAKPTLTASATTIQAGTDVTFSWASTGATSCTLNPGSIPANGDQGSVVVSSIMQTTAYTITCQNAAGSTESDKVAITITQGEPSVPDAVISDLTISPSHIANGQTTTLTWITSGVVADGCRLDPSPLTNAPANGNWTTPALTKSTTYTLTCVNSKNASATASVSVVVDDAPAPVSPSPQVPLVSSPQNQATTVTANDGSSVTNTTATDTATGDVTLEPSNVTSDSKTKSIKHVEFYDGQTLLQDVTSEPFTLDTTKLKNGQYTVTERTYFDDGSMSETTQVVNVANTITAKKKSGAVLLWILPVILIIGGGLFFLVRKLTGPSYYDGTGSGDGTYGYDVVPAASASQTPDWQQQFTPPDDPNKRNY